MLHGNPSILIQVRIKARVLSQQLQPLITAGAYIVLMEDMEVILGVQPLVERVMFHIHIILTGIVIPQIFIGQWICQRMNLEYPLIRLEKQRLRKRTVFL